ncbi:hypothetical protein K1719_012374 [Acacia pycnantha]|nr:hypothetical protein K1719_012374 [Acacia pycnantha]
MLEKQKETTEPEEPSREEDDMVLSSEALYLSFHKALKEACEVVCNKSIASTPNVELVATFCDNMLNINGGGSENLSDEAIDETLDRGDGLLSCI